MLSKNSFIDANIVLLWTASTTCSQAESSSAKILMLFKETLSVYLTMFGRIDFRGGSGKEKNLEI